MKKICYILLFAIILGPIATLTGCKKEEKIEWDMTNFKYFSLNIPGFNYLKIEDDPDIDAEGEVKNYSPGLQFKVSYQFELSKGYKPVKFEVTDNNGGKLKGPNGKKLKVGDSLLQGNFPVIIDKFCLAWDVVLITFVKDYDNYTRPNNNTVEWIRGGQINAEERAYDLNGYVSDENRASFAIDIHTGKMYYIEPGNIINVSEKRDVQALLRFTPEYTAQVVTETQPVYYLDGVLRDRYGQVFAHGQNTARIDYENKVLYYTNIYTKREWYVLTEEGTVIYIDIKEPNIDEEIINGIYEIGDNFTFTPVTADFVLKERTNGSTRGVGLGAVSFCGIENGYLYVYNYSRKEISKYGFLEDKSKETIKFYDTYSNNFVNIIRNGETIESGSYAVGYWDYDTVLILKYNNGTKTIDWYYANIFEENEFDGTLETFGKLHPLLMGCDPKVDFPTYIDVPYNNLSEANKNYAKLEKCGVTYKLVENEELNTIEAIEVVIEEVVE